MSHISGWFTLSGDREENARLEEEVEALTKERDDVPAVRGLSTF